MKTLQDRFLLTFFMLPVITASVCFCQQTEYWQMTPGYFGNNLVSLDSTVAFLANDVEYMDGDGYHGQYPALSILHYNHSGKLVSENRFNPNYLPSVQLAELLRGDGRSSVTRLSNGNFLLGGHAMLILDSLDSLNPLQTNQQKAFQELNSYPQNNSEETISFFMPKSYSGEQKDENPPMVHPMIFTFDQNLDSLLRMDTLQAVPYASYVNLVHEMAPDTLILAFNKSYTDKQVVMQTDSLFNIRWSTEFGTKESWFGDVHDFVVTKEGDIIIIVRYRYLHPRTSWGLFSNVLFKFSGKTGEMLWEKKIEREGNLNTFAAIQPLNDHTFLLAYDDCCLVPTDVIAHDVTLHEKTGLHFKVIDAEGNTLQEKSLVDFLSAFIYTWAGENYTGTYEDPDEAYPWFIPVNMNRTEDNSFLITGMHKSVAPITHLRGFLLKVDENLEPKWVRVFQIDEKNYPYADNWLLLNSIAQLSENIFTGGVFWSVGSSEHPSPYYPGFWRSAILIALDEYGCWEPGCHLTDNIASYLLDDKNILLYPNPTAGQLGIKIDLPELEAHPKTLFISNMKGEKILLQQFSENHTQMDVSHISSGIYLVYIFYKGHILFSKKLIINQ